VWDHRGRVLSAIVVNHRSNPLADACVRSLLGGTLPPDEVIVVDNEGRDGGVSAALAADPAVRVVVRDDNPGYAAACNAGASLAEGDLLLFLNADVTVDTECVERCVGALVADPGVAVVTPRLERLDGSLDHASHRGLPTPGASLAYKLGLDRLFPRSRRMGRYTMSWLDPLTEHDVEACSGAFMLVRRSALVRAGAWDERYRFYAEDLDLCLRIGSMGGRIRYLGSARATHLKGAFSHHDTPDDSLDDRELAVKRWVQREIVASHRLFFEEHLRAQAALPTRLAIELMFSLQSLRLQGRDRAARA
jgi:GT2 family glycosyltransferase